MSNKLKKSKKSKHVIDYEEEDILLPSKKRKVDKVEFHEPDDDEIIISDHDEDQKPVKGEETKRMSNKLKKSKKRKHVNDCEEEDILFPSKKKKVNKEEFDEPDDDEIIISDHDEDQKPVKEESEEWTKEDYYMLINRMEEQIPKKETKRFIKQAELLDWNMIKFGDHSVEECQEKWKIIKGKVRHYRLLSEVLQDAKVWAKNPWTAPMSKRKIRHPEKPPRPMSSFMLFYMDKKDKIIKKNPNFKLTEISKCIGEKYKALSEAKKAYYVEKALQGRREYQKKLAIFYEKYPEYIPATKKQMNKSKKPLSPYKLYLREKLSKHEHDEDFDQHEYIEKYKEAWKHLSFKKKSYWINLAKEEEEKYLENLHDDLIEDPESKASGTYRSVISKEENLILDRLAGKPEKPPNSAYSLFSKLMLQDKDINHVEGEPKNRMKEVALKWKEVPEEQKKEYAERVQHMLETYKLEFANYLESLPEEKKAKELANLQPKKRTAKLKQKAVTKGTSGSKSQDIFKNEPEKPPVTAWDLYKIEFIKKNSDLPSKTACKNAAIVWKNLSKKEQEKYIKKHKKLKDRYMIDFEKFLQSLSADELRLYSALKSDKTVQEMDEDLEEESSSEEVEHSSSNASDSEGDSDSGASEEDDD